MYIFTVFYIHQYTKIVLQKKTIDIILESEYVSDTESEDSTNEDEDTSGNTSGDTPGETSGTASGDTSDSRLFPSEPLAFVFYLMMLFLNAHLTEDASEIIMGFFNVALELMEMSYRFPRKKSTFENRSGVNSYLFDGVKQYVDCLKCHNLYSIEHDQLHRQANFKCKSATRTDQLGNVSRTCGEPLYTVTKAKTYLPRAVYMYNSIIETLRKFYMRDNFANSVKAWKSRNLKDDDHYYDVYDGDVFKSFKIDEQDTTPFVDQSDHNLMLSIGVDWYQNYTYSSHSTGAIYLSILNLPKQMRDTRPYVMLAGLMPGPKESKLDEINNYLAPLVEELMLLKTGVTMSLPDNTSVFVRAALTLVVADLPAAAKLCGFSFFNSICACRKCDRRFPALVPGLPGRDYSGWEDHNWPRRNKASNLRYAKEWKRATTEAKRVSLVQENGTRWSQLHLLDYFDPVRFTVYDSMHNLYMGTTKRILSMVWIKEGHLTKNHLKEMALMSDKIILPFGYDSGSIARKILVGDGFSYMKAAEYMVFTVCLSPLLLKGRLPVDMYANWMLFVEAVQLMSTTSISKENVTKAHGMLRSFCIGFTRLYGKESLYPNAHNMLHLAEGIKDYGPLCSHSAFFYERCNKDLKNVSTNKKPKFEHTVMSTFLKTVHHVDLTRTFPSLGLGNNLDTRLKNLFIGVDIHATRQYYVENILKAEILQSISTFDIFAFLAYGDTTSPSEAYGHEVLPPITIRLLKFNKKPFRLSYAQFGHLVDYYRSISVELDNCLLNGTQPESRVSNLMVKFNTISIMGHKYNSNETASARGSFIRAYYNPNVAGMSPQLRPAQIKFFFRHDVRLHVVDDIYVVSTFTFAFVHFYKPHQTLITTFNSINSGVCQNTFEDESELCILPIANIHSPIGMYFDVLSNTNIFFTVHRKLIEQ